MIHTAKDEKAVLQFSLRKFFQGEWNPHRDIADVAWNNPKGSTKRHVSVQLRDGLGVKRAGRQRARRKGRFATQCANTQKRDQRSGTRIEKKARNRKIQSD